jgi:hypothetical protein
MKRWKFRMGEGMAKPERDVLKERPERFQSLLQYVGQRGGRIVSGSGLPVVQMQTLPDSSLPADLAALGYRPVDAGESERIIPGSIAEVVLIEGSTATRTVHHGGIVKVKCWTFSL